MKEDLYSIEAITKRSTIDAAGKFKEVYEIVFVTKSGVHDTIEIPADKYTPEYVEKTLTELSTTHEKIMTGQK